MTTDQFQWRGRGKAQTPLFKFTVDLDQQQLRSPSTSRGSAVAEGPRDARYVG